MLTKQRKKNKRAVAIQLMSACVSLWISCTTIKKWPNLFFFQLLDVLIFSHLSENPCVRPHGDLHEWGGAGSHEDEQVGHGEVQQEQVRAAAEKLKGEGERRIDVKGNKNTRNMVVQLNFIKDIEVFYMLFDRSLSIFSMTSLKQHIEWILPFPVLNPIWPPRRIQWWMVMPG